MKSKRLFVFLSIVMLSFPLRAQTTLEYLLVMRNTGLDTMWDGTQIKTFGFAPDILNSWLPGPLIICNEGDSLSVRAWNISQGAHHTVHWHGLDVDMRNDGVHQYSFGIHHMEDCTYVFKASHAGSYLYHCHVASIVHVQMGMYGPVVVTAANGAKTVWTGGPAFDQEKIWLSSEIDKSWHDTVPIHNLGDSLFEAFQVPPYLPDYFLINGKSKSQLGADMSIRVEAMVGEKVLLRLLNLGFLGNRYIFSPQLNAIQVMSDGRPLPQSIRSDTIRVLPGERYEVLITPSLEFDYSVLLEYFDMDNRAVWDVEFIPVSVHGVIGFPNEGDENQRIAIWPNPNNGEISIAWEALQAPMQHLEIINAIGQTIYRNNELDPFDGLVHANISGVNPGIYFVRMQIGDAFFVRRIILQP